MSFSLFLLRLVDEDFLRDCVRAVEGLDTRNDVSNRELFRLIGLTRWAVFASTTVDMKLR